MCNYEANRKDALDVHQQSQHGHFQYDICDFKIYTFIHIKSIIPLQWASLKPWILHE